MKKRLIVSLALFLLSSVSNPALAEGDNETKTEKNAGIAYVPLPCGPTDAFLDVSKSREERIVFLGDLTPPFYTFMALNNKTRTYSIFVVNKKTGISCVVASGQGFQAFLENLSI